MNYKEEIKTILSYAVLNMISLTSLTLVSAFWNTNYNDMLQIELDDLSVLHYTVISVNLLMILISVGFLGFRSAAQCHKTLTQPVLTSFKMYSDQ